MNNKILKLSMCLIWGFFIIMQHRSADINRGQVTILQAGIQLVSLTHKTYESKKLADHMYKRIKHYQKYEGWYDRTVEVYHNWEKLQKEK